MKKVPGQGRKFIVVLMAAGLLAGAAASAFCGAFPEPGSCDPANLAPIPHSVIKADLFVANTLDQINGVIILDDLTAVAPVVGVDVYVTGKCDGGRRIPPSRVQLPLLAVGGATIPSDLVGLTIEKTLVDPAVEAKCFDAAKLAINPLVGYRIQAVDDFTRRGYYLLFNDPFGSGPYPVLDYAIQTEARIVGLYCRQ